jgi:hypothetical protein
MRICSKPPAVNTSATEMLSCTPSSARRSRRSKGIDSRARDGYSVGQGRPSDGHGTHDELARRRASRATARPGQTPGAALRPDQKMELATDTGQTGARVSPPAACESRPRDAKRPCLGAIGPAAGEDTRAPHKPASALPIFIVCGATRRGMASDRRMARAAYAACRADILVCHSNSPLTPALSQRERVNCRLPVRPSAARRFAAARDTVLPLPGQRAGVRGNKPYESEL